MEAEKIVCALCKGTASDPYVIPSRTTACDLCHGMGTVSITDLHMPCRYCGGSGNISTSSCPACRGAGVVPMIPGAMKPCPACEGRAYETWRGSADLGEGEGRGLVPNKYMT